MEQYGEAATGPGAGADPGSLSMAHRDQIQDFVEAEVRAETFRPPVEPSTLAYAIVRLAEAFLFNDATAAMRGDVDRLREIEAALLGV